MRNDYFEQWTLLPSSKQLKKFYQEYALNVVIESYKEIKWYTQNVNNDYELSGIKNIEDVLQLSKMYKLEQDKA